MNVKAIIGFDINPALSREEFNAWLHDVHLPDLQRNPYLDKVVLNTVVRPGITVAGGMKEVQSECALVGVCELHYASEAAYQDYLEWFRQHPIAPERGPAGRTQFRFYYITHSNEVAK